MKRHTFLAAGAGAVLAGCAGAAVPSGAPAPSDARSNARGLVRKSESGAQLLGSLLLVPYGYAPQEFAPCDGAMLQINSNLALFSLLYTKFGGDGKQDFALPDLRGREPIKGLSYVIATDGVFPGRKVRGSNGVGPLLGQLLAVPYLPKFVPPPGWAVCDGRVLQIRDHRELFSVIGAKFGGDDRTTFALPDLRGHEPAKDVTYVIALEGRYPARA